MKYEERKIDRPLKFYQMGFWQTGMDSIDGLYDITYMLTFYSSARESTHDRRWTSMQNRIQQLSQSIVVSIHDHEAVSKYADEYALRSIERMYSSLDEFQRYRQHGTNEIRPILFVNFDANMETFHKRFHKYAVELFDSLRVEVALT